MSTSTTTGSSVGRGAEPSAALPATDDLGPEAIVRVYDPESDMHGVLVVDNSVLGPCGGGTRMMPDLTIGEIADLARSMTYKFGILGLPRGGSKAGVWGDPHMEPARKRKTMGAFGRALRFYLQSNEVAVGPDMGVTVGDVQAIYDGAQLTNARSGLFAKPVNGGDPAAYHITGYGVVMAVRSACEVAGISLAESSIAVEGFGQVGAGACRYAAKFGAKVVAVSTIKGGIYNAEGLDVERLLALRREYDDDCVLRYEGAEPIPADQIYYLPVDILVPGARPYVIHEENLAEVQARAIVSGGNITVTKPAQDALHSRGVLVVPDFISNSGAAIASWVDFLAGDFDQALATIERLIYPITGDVLREAEKAGRTPYDVATARVANRIQANRGKPRKSFEEISSEIRAFFGM